MAGPATTAATTQPPQTIVVDTSPPVFSASGTPVTGLYRYETTAGAYCEIPAGANAGPVDGFLMTFSCNNGTAVASTPDTSSEPWSAQVALGWNERTSGVDLQTDPIVTAWVAPASPAPTTTTTTPSS